MDLQKLSQEAFETTKAHGWHDIEQPDGHEIWKDIKGYEGLYQVSNIGRVRSLDTLINNHRGVYIKRKRVKAISDATGGYKSVCLCKNGTHKTCLVHILVAKAFIPNPFNKRTVNHKDCNKSNNCVSNLEWATDSENIKHAYMHGLKKSPKAQLGKFGFRSSKGIPVVQIDKRTNRIIFIYGSAKDAQRHTGVNYTDILYCTQGKLKTAGGFIWRVYGSCKSLPQKPF